MWGALRVYMHKTYRRGEQKNRYNQFMQNTAVGNSIKNRKSSKGAFIREDTLVTELECLGIRYIYRSTTCKVADPRPIDYLLADVVRQPSSRVRGALISLLLLHPEYSSHVPFALKRLRGENRWLFKIYYTAAVILQAKYYDRLQSLIQGKWVDLPDLFSPELSLPADASLEEKLRKLGEWHQLQIGELVNWVGTYDNAARHLIHQLELEVQWSQ